MKRITIANTNLSVSRFSFGTASLHHMGSVGAQREHLEAAADAGISHFDTAPLYGFGSAERALGEAFGSSDKVTIATKVGLYAPGGGDQGRAEMMARKVAGKLVPWLSRAAVDLSVGRAHASLEASLRRLRRDKIDLLLLHEPDARLMATEEWMRWLEDEADRIGAFGIAGPREVVAPFLQIGSPLSQVVQTRDSLDTKEADIMAASGRPMQFTYGYFTGDSGGLSAEAILNGAQERNNSGSILVSTRNRDRLIKFAEMAAGERD